MTFKQGQILNFAYTGNLFQRLIKTFTGKWTHSAIIGDIDKEGYVVVYEALNQGFVKSEYEVWWLQARLDNREMAVGESKLPLTNVKENCEKYLGRGYGWGDILRIVRVILTRGRSVDTFDSDKQLICSEAVARILYDSSGKKIILGYKTEGDKSEFNKPFDLITPTDLFNSRQIIWSIK